MFDQFMSFQVSHYDWKYYCLIEHVQHQKELLDPNGKFWTPILLVAFNLRPRDIRTLHEKATKCHKKKCYQKLWAYQDEILYRVRDEL